MKSSNLISCAVLVLVLGGKATPQQATKLGDNAALRYWSAFAQMQDYSISDEDARKLNGILDGRIPYDDAKFKELIEKNRPALGTMARGTALPNCDWGLDYALGSDTPIEYSRKAAALARLNVLYAFHLQLTGDNDGTVRALAAGLRFSRDVAKGGSLLATLIAKDSLVKHLRAIAFVVHTRELSGSQRSALQNAVAQLGPDPLDWKSAMKLEMTTTRQPESVTQSYASCLDDAATLPKLQQTIAALPQERQALIPNPKRVLEEKQELTDKLRETSSMLR